MVAQRAANVHGVYDLHGLVWEWVEDYSALNDGSWFVLRLGTFA